MTINLATGYSTPPLGVSLYISSTVVNRDILFVTKGVLPFLAIQFRILVILI
jgi:C4-dicarboxylate transporter DctM subunit